MKVPLEPSGTSCTFRYLLDHYVPLGPHGLMVLTRTLGIDKYSWIFFLRSSLRQNSNCMQELWVFKIYLLEVQVFNVIFSCIVFVLSALLLLYTLLLVVSVGA